MRTLDAVHLGTILLLRQSIVDLEVLTLDERVRENAALPGLAVSKVG